MRLDQFALIRSRHSLVRYRVRFLRACPSGCRALRGWCWQRLPSSSRWTRHRDYTSPQRIGSLSAAFTLSTAYCSHCVACRAGLFVVLPQLGALGAGLRRLGFCSSGATTPRRPAPHGSAGSSCGWSSSIHRSSADRRDSVVIQLHAVLGFRLAQADFLAPR